MPEPIAYLSGEFIPAKQLAIAPQDMGFVLGVTVAEQLRTFGGRIFRWSRHFARLSDSLQVLGMIDLLEPDSFRAVVEQVTRHNYQLIDPSSDLGITIFVTPGIYPTYAPENAGLPTVVVHTYPLAFSLWADRYQVGQRCVISSVRQVSQTSWPRHLKCRSRAHYFLADQQARHIDAAARAILLDEHGDVNEATTANVIAYFVGEGLVSPPLETILPGVSLQFTAELAKELSISFNYRRLSAAELGSADEIMLTSTPFCLLPVSSIDGRPLNLGPVAFSLLAAWSTHVGVDIMAQARQFCRER